MIGRYWTNLEKTALPTGPALKMLAVNPFKHVQAPRLLALGDEKKTRACKTSRHLQKIFLT